jgi:hypothetical protein
MVIGPEHVGRTMAVFTAVEVKSATGRATAEQRAFIQHVQAAGGIAGVVRSVDEAAKLLATEPDGVPSTSHEQRTSQP